ncbi:uncharacterized protein CC84DRAFT_1191530 [Paraphaeosphaeria sporulosa]|uniref:Lysine-specific metallo-endopeptidase domain-containing protein n=1 Tax=Paraphaeosphaeria sporulosa TaxID=1460663 RepID=A0A177BUD9_9PLEO|nr:uncharacterized protein CC84DRAFT_1191530 [Paraphaeosphaeria sporulosa]OAF99062.1 hypothetical protein CC84DRAFT_1191530 [Paraphaeosphaeria sporulosa]
MYFFSLPFLALSGSIHGAFASPTPSSSQDLSKSITKRGEPNTGADFDENEEPKPNTLEKTETAINDALELASYVTSYIDDDNDIYPHYFDEADRAEIKRIFVDLTNGQKGNDYLDKILIQKSDDDNLCDDQTLAYSNDEDTENPYIVLCPNSFKKKAVTALPSKDIDDEDALDFYTVCAKDGGDLGDTVSYRMNTLGMTLLHEYMHMDSMIKASFGSIVDNPNGNDGYGPVNVYDKIPKDQARLNADSYAYYASHVLWTALCQQDFGAPRPGTDDQDPDCGATVCKP